VEYIGTAEIVEDVTEWNERFQDVTITECRRIAGTDTAEVFPYSAKFPLQLRRDIYQTVLEQRMTPPATPAVLPSEAYQIEVLDVETEYIIRIAAALPHVATDTEAKAYGLSAVRRIIPGQDTYTIRAKGGLEDVRRELSRVKIF
jgi:hypothetical protein